MSGQWVTFGVVLPTAASIEVDLEPAGHLRAHVQLHRDRATLVQFVDELRAAVVDVDAQLAILALEPTDTL